MLNRFLAWAHFTWVALRDGNTGATMTEYGLILAGISLIAFIGAQLLGGDISSKFTSIGNTINP